MHLDLGTNFYVMYLNIFVITHLQRWSCNLVHLKYIHFTCSIKHFSENYNHVLYLCFSHLVNTSMQVYFFKAQQNLIKE